VSPFKVPEPNLQLTFYHRLIEVRETYLLDALLSLVAELDIAQLDRDLSQFVSNTCPEGGCQGLFTLVQDALARC
jgi:hypothetical protein